MQLAVLTARLHIDNQDGTTNLFKKWSQKCVAGTDGAMTKESVYELPYNVQVHRVAVQCALSQKQFD